MHLYSSRHSIRKIASWLAVSALFAIGAASAGAATYNFDPGTTPTVPSGGTGPWDLTSAIWANGGTDTKWTDTSAAGTDIASFGGTAGTVTLSSALSALGLIFTTPGYTISTSNSSTLTLGSSGIDASALTSGMTTISTPLILGASQTWQTGVGSTLIVSGTISNGGYGLTVGGNGSTNITGIVSGTGGLTLSSGTLSMSGANTYTGGTTINGGTFQNAGSSSVFAYGNLTLNAGIINLNTRAITVNNLNGAGGQILNSGTGSGGSTFTVGNNIGANGIFAGTIKDNDGTSTVKVNFTKNGSNTQTLSGSNTYSGTTNINSGTLISTLPTTGGTPFGTGSVILSNGTLSIAPSGSGGAITFAGANALATSAFTFSSDSTLALNKGGYSSLTYTVGNSATASSSLATTTTNSAPYSLIIAPASGLTSLGTSSGESFVVNGGVTVTNGVVNTTATNGVVNTSIIGQDNDVNATGDFLNYGSTGFTGFSRVTYTNSNFSPAPTAATPENVNLNTSVTASTSVYTLRVGIGGVNTAPVTLTISSGKTLTVSGAGLILNGTSGTTGSPGPAVITGGTLALGTQPAVYTNLAGGSISSVITGGGSGTGVSFIGPGILTLTGTNTFSGGAFVNNSTVSVATDSALGSGSSIVQLDGGTLTATASFTLGSTGGTNQRNFYLYAGGANTGGTLNVTGINILTFTNGSKYIRGTGSLTKTGTGSLTLGGTGTNNYSGGTVVNAGTINANIDTALGANTGALVLNPATGNTASVNFTSAAPSIGSLASSGAGTSSVVLGNTASTGTATTLTVGNDNTSTVYSGTISDGKTTSAGAVGSVTKVGTGILTLKGINNTFSGGMTVSAGTVTAPTGGYSNGNVTVASSGTADYTQAASTQYAANISGMGYVTIGANPGGQLSTGGTITYTGTDSVGGGTTVNSGTLALVNTGGAALTGPVTVATGATLQLGANSQATGTANNQIQQASTTGFILSGGTFEANGQNDATITSGTTATPVMGALTLGTGSSILDFGGLSSVLAFANSSGQIWTGTLSILNYLGDPTLAGGSDQLYIGTGQTLSADQLSRITFNGQVARQLASGQVVVVPEPNSPLSLLAGAGLLGGLRLRALRRKAHAA